MQGLRKFFITMASLVTFAIVMLNGNDINPFNLGLGLGLLIAPTSIANIFEHMKGK